MIIQLKGRVQLRICLVFFLACALPFLVKSQSPLDGSTTILNGYASRISGQDFWYHSSIQSARECLLIRATDGTSSMEWSTDPVPAQISTPYVSIVWLAGLGSSPGKASFDLFIDGITEFTFWVDGRDEWLIQMGDSSSLWFRKDMIDQHGDRFGFMVLTLPASKLEPGESLQLKVTGGRFQKTSWYMTFKFPIVNGLDFNAMPALMRTDGGERQLGVASLMHFGSPDTLKIWIDGRLTLKSSLSFGYNHLRVELPLCTEHETLAYRMEIGTRVTEGFLQVYPVRKWEVQFVQHSHTDIGYTRPQTEILGEHVRYIDYALDYCDLTDAYPNESQFRWTCESSWAVDEYLRTRPASQVKRLLRRIREGRIEVTGMYFNFDELPDEQTLYASLRPFRIFRQKGIEARTAMQNDVNGIAWSLSEHLPDLGVKYLNMGTHGHRALICFDKPTLFWWESPSGKRMLAYRAEHYMIGNTRMRIHAGDFDVFETELLNYLNELAAKGYSYDIISLQHSGFITDNSPPSMLASDMIRRWNEKYSWPRLRTATATSFFERMEHDYGDSLPVLRAAWPDWWTDGFGASAREVAALRKAQADLTVAGSGFTLAALMGSRLDASISGRLLEAKEAQLFYTEHTVGYHASVREPFSLNSMEQRALKESYAWEAARRASLLGTEALGLLQPKFNREADPSIVLFNTLGWNRNGLSRIYIDHQILPPYTPVCFLDREGRIIPAQPLEKHPDGTYWAIQIDSIPAFGYKKLFINSKNPEATLAWPVNIPSTDVLENKWYLIHLDTSKACIISVFDKELQKELVDNQAVWGLGALIHEQLDNREQLESFRLNSFTRQGLDSAWIESVSTGPLWTAIRFRGNTGAAMSEGGFSFELRLFTHSKRIDLVYEINKSLNVSAEGLYVALPFYLPEAQLAFEVPGAEIRAGIDQIPGSANDWNTVQTYARLYSNEAQILISSAECPLMQFGGINTGRYKAGALPASTHIFGWPMNNYWTTNYNAYQIRAQSWTYTITSVSGHDPMMAARFGWGTRIPIPGIAMPGGGIGDEQTEASYLQGLPENLILISAMPEEDGKSAILLLRESGGRYADLQSLRGPNGKPLKLHRVDAAAFKTSNQGMTIKPYESVFIRVLF
jgi:alpha-mannosidase